MSRKITVDKAGATSGGARRFLLELEDYLASNPRSDVELIGGANLSPRWLIEREIAAANSERISLNNASFAFPGKERTVLLRNALHFASEQEFKDLGYTPSAHMRRQIPVIRFLAHRADKIIVPCTAMAERVAHHAPKLRNKITVRFHPVSPRGWSAEMPDQERPVILVPIIPQSYKRLDLHIPAILKASEGTNAVIAVTALPGEIPTADGHPQYMPIGKMPAEELAIWWGRAMAVFFPPSVESFGYALAEARCGGRPVIAPNTQQNKEIAGPALRGYKDDNQLAEAVRMALNVPVQAESDIFNPQDYFDKLFL